ncbi:MAG TPA: PAS domain-containing protein [Steroidobacteraceae bacterium]|nr:PAS domain-containing protein [Steroidobacteraceae bacterium]
MSATPRQAGAEELEAKVAGLEAELDALHTRLADAEQTLEAIRQGEVDALVIDSPEGQKIFSLTGAERPYRTLVEQMTEGAATLDGAGSIRYCNKAFADLLRRPLEDLTGGLAEQYVQSADRHFFQSMLRQSRSRGVHGEIGLCAADGGVVPVNVSLTRIIDHAPESVCMVVTDLTERKQAERLSTSEQFVHGLIEQAPIGVAVVDQTRRYILANPVYRSLARNTLVTGCAVEEAFAPPIVRMVDPLVQQVLATDKAVNVPECALSDGVESWWNITLVPLHESGAVASVLIVAEDITTRKQAESGLRRSQDALREADRRKDEFLATLAHELRNPLAPIRTAAQILGSPKLAAQQLQWAHNVIQRQVGHMALLLDDLLDIARITRGKLEIKKERVRLTDVVDSAVEAARPLLDGKHHHFSVVLPAAELQLDADPLRLSQVLSNLLTNASKYTDPAGHIKLSAFVEDGVLCVSVKDDGIGIAPASLDGIFEMFSQVDSAADRTEGGLGIGLALVKGIVGLHGGTVSAQSAGPGCGSEFIVRLPLAPGARTTASPTHCDVPTVAVPARRVVVADDNKDAADSLAMLLELSGHDVRVAHGGRGALSLAQTFRPDVVILDIGMPDLSGYDVAAQLRREPWGEGIVLIALTGWGRDDDRQRATAAGFDLHMTKPVDPEKIEVLLSNRRPQ